jgi:tetratricopeptide (TPR) repeat protein
LIRQVCVVAALIVCSCAKRESAQPLHIGLIPAENLSGDDSLDWIAVAVPVLIASQLEGMPDTKVVRAPSRRDIALAGAQALLCRFDAHAGRLLLDCWQEGLDKSIHSAGSLEDGLAAIITPIGQALHPRARPAPVASDRALRAYAAKDFLEAARLAPDFGYAYTDGASAALLAGDRAKADRLIADGMARGAGIGDISRARLYLLSGSIGQNREDQIEALRQLTALIPGEPEYWQRLAQLLSARKQFAEAAAAQEKLTGLRPDDAAVWNQLAYLRAYASDTPGAKAAVARYEKLAPGNANVADTFGDVCFYAGEFADAEKHYLESMSRDSSFQLGQGYFKAAMARLRLGDAGKAEEHFRQFADKGGAAREFLLAQWRFISTGDGMAEMEQVAKQPGPDMAAAALAQIAVWRQTRGESAKAQDAARQALFSAKTPISRRSAQIAYFVTLPAADPGEWRARAEKLLPGPEFRTARRQLVLEALIAHREFAAALPLAREMFEETAPPEDAAPRIYLAWCLSETGSPEKARELLVWNAAPAAPLGGPFDSVLLRKELDLRKAAN